jgi:hypothetical protein
MNVPHFKVFESQTSGSVAAAGIEPKSIEFPSKTFQYSKEFDEPSFATIKSKVAYDL